MDLLKNQFGEGETNRAANKGHHSKKCHVRQNARLFFHVPIASVRVKETISYGNTMSYPILGKLPNLKTLNIRFSVYWYWTDDDDKDPDSPPRETSEQV